jgi:putative serine protease PepD
MVVKPASMGSAEARGWAEGARHYCFCVTDDPEDDEESQGDPPHPLDRVWFHPSELSAHMPPTPVRSSGREWRTATAAALFGALVTAGLLSAVGALDDDVATQIEQSRLTAVSAAAGDVARIVKAAAPSVVSVRAETDAGTVTGSGVALGRTQVLTSASLLATASAVTISTRDGRVLTVRVVGMDSATDLALLSVETRGARGKERTKLELEPAELGSTDDLDVGQTIIALGMSSGDHEWADNGVVNALDRLVAMPDGLVLAGLVETDVEPGDAIGGGALLDTSASVVGILTRSAPGRAVPIEVARDVADQLATTGKVHHGWLGLDAADAGDRPGGGARVTSVAAGGPAAVAGIRMNDVIVRIGNERVTDLADLIAAIARRRPGDPVDITFWRMTRRMHREVDLAERKMPSASP